MVRTLIACAVLVVAAVITARVCSAIDSVWMPTCCWSVFGLFGVSIMVALFESEEESWDDRP